MRRAEQTPQGRVTAAPGGQGPPERGLKEGDQAVGGGPERAGVRRHAPKRVKERTKK